MLFHDNNKNRTKNIRHFLQPFFDQNSIIQFQAVTDNASKTQKLNLI